MANGNLLRYKQQWRLCQMYGINYHLFKRILCKTISFSNEAEANSIVCL